MLRTLAYRVPASVLGDVVTYPLSEEFVHAWDQLPRRDGRGQQAPRPYASLAAALRAVTCQPVRLFAERELDERDREQGTRALLLSTQPIEPRRLAVAVRAWERQVQGSKDTSTLASLLPDPDPPRAVASSVDHQKAAPPRAPGWVFDVAAWEAARRLSAHPLQLDGHAPVRLRLDSEGDLLAWDDPVAHTARNGQQGHALVRISAKVITVPGVTDLLLAFHAQLTRLDRRWNGVKHAWIDRDDPQAPVLRVGVQSRRLGETWITSPSDFTAEVVEACGLEVLSLPPTLTQPPGAVRAIVPRSVPHLVGKGVGPRFLLRLADHIERHLPELMPLRYERTAISASRPSARTRARHGILEDRRQRIPLVELPSAIIASGHQHLRVVFLYATPQTRHRMTAALSQWTGLSAAQPDDDLIPFGDRASLVFHHVPEPLKHGPQSRNALLTDAPGLHAGDETMVAALIETEWSTEREIADDAKPQLRRLLAQHGIVTQFLDRRDPAPKPDDDHAVHAALRDLLRSAGLLDRRLALATARPNLTNGLKSPVLLVGLHARSQTTQHGKPRFVTTAVALRAQPDLASPWTATMYSDQDGWTSYARGLTHFHAGNLGRVDLGRHAESADKSRAYVSGVLDALQPSESVVIFVDAEAWRTVFPGLQNARFGNSLLPGDNLRAAGRDVAVVRCNTGNEVPRPVTRVGEPPAPADPAKPATPGAGLYTLSSASVPTWLLAGASRTYRAKGGSLGASYTRWTLPDHLAGKKGEDWHSYTATEIAVACHGTWQPEALAALTARLCDQTVAWEDRTRLPAPLHLARVADLTHPDFRTREDVLENRQP